MAETKKVSIHRALVELKNLDDRINSATREAVVVIANRKSNDKINGVPVEDYKKQMQGSYDKVNSLIDYRNRLKSAVVQSNAETKVKVAGEEMTVAQVIDRKDSIQYKKNLLHSIQLQYRNSVNFVAKENNALPAKLETYLISILGHKEKQTEEDVKLHTETFMKRNEHEMIDPINVLKVITDLEDYIDEFESEVDAILSESNATTFIEIEA